MSRMVFAVAVVAIMLFMSGCGPRINQATVEERPAVAEDVSKVNVSAYLFDAKLRFEGKPRSFRLEIFCTDSIAALAGRAYLGRGALRGRLTTDSLLVYFPSRDEYVRESTAALLSANDCLQSGPEVNLLELFSSLPDKVLDSTQFVVIVDTSDNRRDYHLSVIGCPWKINLLYDRDDDSWRLREFAVDNGRDMTLSARRRSFKKQTEIERLRFQVPLPATAAPIRL